MKIVSLFSGVGGLDLGFIKAGHEVIWANDIDKDAVETYKLNIGNHIVLGDIKEINSNDIPNCDIILGGFPCQGFSIANMKRNIGDERNSLYLEFYRVIKDKQPKYFVAENVKGILSLGGGQVIKNIIGDFEDAGYRVKYKLINMANYGVPQIRQRVIIVGVRKDITKDIEFPTETHSEREDNSYNLKRWVSIGEALKDIPEPSPECALKNHECSQYKVFKDKNFTGHRMVDPSRPSPTILARGNGKGGVVVIHHPSNKRRMSVRETAIIQTFPIDFEFVGSRSSCYRQIGNAVPCLFSKQLGLQFKE